jgi:protein-S-isoprenylcysteine O-methyltransferase Ste14
MTSSAGAEPQRSGSSPGGWGVARRALALLLGRSIFGLVSGWRANLLLFAVTVVELGVLLRLTTTFEVEDWVYLSGHILVLAISLTRRRAAAQDQSWATALAVLVSYAYPYVQVVYLDRMDGYVAWPQGGAVLVMASALLSLAALISIGRRFGVRPALRGLATGGPYRLVRHPMYLAYVIADVGYLLQEWNIGCLLIAAAGWASLVWRIRAEERLLSADAGWSAYAGKVCYRLFPGLW